LLKNNGNRLKWKVNCRCDDEPRPIKVKKVQLKGQQRDQRDDQTFEGDYGEKLEKIILDFEQTLQAKLNRLKSAGDMVLSTSLDNKVTSRMVTCACEGRTVVFLSWKHHTKCLQIAKNQHVALCYENLQIQGLADIMGSPFSENNKVYADLLKEKISGIYKRFSRYKGMVIVKIEITRIHSWEDWHQQEGSYVIDIVDLEKRTAYKVNAEDETLH
jgi:general stress protein 26